MSTPPPRPGYVYIVSKKGYYRIVPSSKGRHVKLDLDGTIAGGMNDQEFKKLTGISNMQIAQAVKDHEQSKIDKINREVDGIVADIERKEQTRLAKIQAAMQSEIDAINAERQTDKEGLAASLKEETSKLGEKETTLAQLKPTYETAITNYTKEKSAWADFSNTARNLDKTWIETYKHMDPAPWGFAWRVNRAYLDCFEALRNAGLVKIEHGWHGPPCCYKIECVTLYSNGVHFYHLKKVANPEFVKLFDKWKAHEYSQPTKPEIIAKFEAIKDSMSPIIEEIADLKKHLDQVDSDYDNQIKTFWEEHPSPSAPSGPDQDQTEDDTDDAPEAEGEDSQGD